MFTNKEQELLGESKPMKSLEYVKNHYNEIEEDTFFDKRWTSRFLDFLPVEEHEKYGFKYTGDPENSPTPKEWTEDNILEQLKKDVEFGIEKATDHRGISASLMFDVVKAWCKVLENGLENIDYGWYGHKLFEAVDKYYNFGLVKEDTFDEDFFRRWS